jgi:hypothetical protein
MTSSSPSASSCWILQALCLRCNVPALQCVCTALHCSVVAPYFCCTAQPRHCICTALSCTAMGLRCTVLTLHCAYTAPSLRSMVSALHCVCTALSLHFTLCSAQPMYCNIAALHCTCTVLFLNNEYRLGERQPDPPATRKDYTFILLFLNCTAHVLHCSFTNQDVATTKKLRVQHLWCFCLYLARLSTKLKRFPQISQI